MFYYSKLEKINRDAKNISIKYFIDKIAYNDLKDDLDRLASRIKKVANTKNKKKIEMLKNKLANNYFSVFCLRELMLINENLYSLLGDVLPISSYFAQSVINNISYRVYNYDKIASKCDEVLNEDFMLDSIFIEDMFAILYGKPNFKEGLINIFNKDRCQLMIIKFHDELNKRQQDFKEQEDLKLKEQNEIFNSKIDNYINETISLVESVNIIDSNTKYHLPLKNKFENKPLYRNGVQIKDRVDYIHNNYTLDQLISMINNDANPYALYKYFVGAIVGKYSFDLSLKDNVLYLLNNLTVEDHYIFNYGAKKLSKTSIGIIIMYFMHYYGIIFEEDKNKAARIILDNASILEDEHFMYFDTFFEKYIYSYVDAIGVFNSYTSLIEKYVIWGSASTPYKVYVSYLKYKQKEDGNDYVINCINKIRIDYIQEALKREFSKLFTKEEETIEEVIEPKKEKKKIELKKEEKPEQEDIEDLMKKTKDAEAMRKVGRYYFDKAFGHEGEASNYLKAIEYLTLSGDLGMTNSYYSAGIALRNYGISNNDPIIRQKYYNESLELFYKHSMDDFGCAFAFIIYESYSQNKYENHSLKLLSKYRNDKKVKPYYIELLEYFRNKEYLNIYHKIYLLKDEIDKPPYSFVMIIKEMISHLKLGKEKEMKAYTYGDILKINNLDELHKNESELSLVVEYLLTYIDDDILKLNYADFISKGNDFFKKDIRKAYSILREFNGVYPEKTTYYNELLSSLEKELQYK